MIVQNTINNKNNDCHLLLDQSKNFFWILEHFSCVHSQHSQHTYHRRHKSERYHQFKEHKMHLTKILYLPLLFFIGLSQIEASSGCNQCARTGNCNAAFHGGPGQFCGYFRDYGIETKPCCCPNSSTCNNSPFECLCHVPDTPYYNYSGRDESIGGFFALMVILCLCCCCCNACRSGDRHTYSTLGEEGSTFIPVAVPAGTDSGNGGNPPPTAPTASYHELPGDSHSRGGGGGGGSNTGTFGGGWGPALGGFVLGEMLGRASGGGNYHRHNNHNWFGGGGGHGRRGHRGGGGGGFNIRGDTGGGGHGHRGGHGGHNIRGDS